MYELVVRKGTILPVVWYAMLLHEIKAAVWACTRLINSQSGAKEGLMDPPPWELLATSGCWGRQDRVVDFSCVTAKPTRLQWMVLHIWSYYQSWLDSMGHNTRQKRLECGKGAKGRWRRWGEGNQVLHAHVRTH